MKKSLSSRRVKKASPGQPASPKKKSKPKPKAKACKKVNDDGVEVPDDDDDEDFQLTYSAGGAEPVCIPGVAGGAEPVCIPGVGFLDLLSSRIYVLQMCFPHGI